jgi:cytochrome c biogenesis protein
MALLRQIKPLVNLLINLKFALALLALIAIFSSLGSILEQDQPRNFYETNYPSINPLYGFLDSRVILACGLDQIYRTPWFLSLLFVLGLSLFCCSLLTQFPLVSKAKDLTFKQRLRSFLPLPFFIRLYSQRFLSETYLFRFEQSCYSLYQKNNVIYGYQGILGRFSPIFVHISLLFILFGAGWGAFQNLKDQEFLAKGEIFHVQNPIQSGPFSSIPDVSMRVNDFWVEYRNNRVHQFYSNISLLDSIGNETKQQTISVNHPFHFDGFDIYQSDWSLLGLRVQPYYQTEGKQIPSQPIEIPLFSLQNDKKAWITWIHMNTNPSSSPFLMRKAMATEKIDKTIKTRTSSQSNSVQLFPVVFDQFQEVFYLYDQTGKMIELKNMGDIFTFKVGTTEETSIQWMNLISATGLLMKSDPSIPFIYFGFAGLMLTTAASYLPYTQIWLIKKPKFCWIGCQTNRGHLSVEIPFKTIVSFPLQNDARKTRIEKKRIEANTTKE